MPAIDVHTHAGGLVRLLEPLRDVAGPMRGGGLTAACFNVVPDAPLLRQVGSEEVVITREPAGGELARYTDRAFRRFDRLVAEQGLAHVLSKGDLARAEQAGRPAAILAVEGADHWEGDLARLERDFDRNGLRHVQLVHFRVNEIGDVQTAPPVHGGLTAFGRAVIQAANRLGLVVDVAHASFATVRDAAQTTRSPLVCSHTFLVDDDHRHPRLIDGDYARLIASTGGIVGVWPLKLSFDSFQAFISGIRRMVDLVGIDHVGIGTDTGWQAAGSSWFDDYGRTAEIGAALRSAGFLPDEAEKILGGNYARVFESCMASDPEA